jgi:hypothetical protein
MSQQNIGTLTFTSGTCPRPLARRTTMTDLATGSSSTTGAQPFRVARHRGHCDVSVRCHHDSRMRPLLTASSRLHVQHPQVHSEWRVPAAHPVARNPQPRWNTTVLHQLRPGQRNRRRQRHSEPDSQDPRRIQGHGPWLHCQCKTLDEAGANREC